MGFGDYFSFSRSRTASCRDLNGALVTVAPDVPRFDHDLGGAPLGLIVEAGKELGQQDRLGLAVELPIEGPATVFHATTEGDGAVVRRAYYTHDASATVNALLRMSTRHRSIGCVAGFVAVRSGLVRYRGFGWEPPAVLTADDALLSGGGERPLVCN